MKLGPLTERETEIVLLSAEGHRQESLCNQLEMKPDTVKAHLNNIFRKLGFNSTLEVVAWYYKNNWQPIGDVQGRLQQILNELKEKVQNEAIS